MKDAMTKSFFGALTGLAPFSIATIAFAQGPGAMKQNQTRGGYGDGKLLQFTYPQNFDCIDQPNDDLNFNMVKGKADPGEMQILICQADPSHPANANLRARSAALIGFLRALGASRQ